MPKICVLHKVGPSFSRIRSHTCTCTCILYINFPFPLFLHETLFMGIITSTVHPYTLAFDINILILVHVAGGSVLRGVGRAASFQAGFHFIGGGGAQCDSCRGEDYSNTCTSSVVLINLLIRVLQGSCMLPGKNFNFSTSETVSGGF